MIYISNHAIHNLNIYNCYHDGYPILLKYVFNPIFGFFLFNLNHVWANTLQFELEYNWKLLVKFLALKFNLH